MRLIDAIPLVQEAQRFRGVFKTDLEKYVADMFIRMLDFAPTIEAETVKHGRWIHDINNLYGCSECLERETMSHKKLKNYCPNCGCKMDLEGKG